MALLEDVALPESLGRRIVPRLKRWSNLKHYKWSVSFKERAIEGKARAVRYQSKGTLKQRPFDRKGKGFSKGKAKAIGP
jgi:hypothetical protein